MKKRYISVLAAVLAMVFAISTLMTIVHAAGDEEVLAGDIGSGGDISSSEETESSEEETETTAESTTAEETTEATTEAESTAETKAEETVTADDPVVIVDEEGNELEAAVEVVDTKTFTEEHAEEAVAKYPDLADTADELEILAVYEVKAEDFKGGKLTLYADDLKAGDDAVVLHWINGEELEMLTGTVADKQITVEVKSLSPFAVVRRAGDKDESTTAAPAETTTAAAETTGAHSDTIVVTGDEFNGILWISLASISLLAVAALLIVRKHVAE